MKSQDIVHRLARAQSSARRADSKLVIVDHRLFEVQGRLSFERLQKFDGVDAFRAGLPSVANTVPITAGWLQRRACAVKTWKKLLTEKTVRRDNRKALAEWHRDIARLQSRIDEVAELRRSVDAGSAAADRFDWLVLSETAGQEVGRLGFEAARSGRFDLPDEWRHVFRAIMWIGGGDACRRLFEAAKPMLPEASVVRQRAAVIEILRFLRECKEWLQRDSEGLLAEWQRRFDRWPADIIEQANLSRPTQRRYLAIQRSGDLDRCQKLLKTLPAQMPARLLWTVGLLCCFGPAQTNIPTEVFLKPDTGDDYKWRDAQSISSLAEMLMEVKSNAHFRDLLTMTRHGLIHHARDLRRHLGFLQEGSSVADLIWFVANDLLFHIEDCCVDVGPLRELHSYATSAGIGEEQFTELLATIRNPEDSAYFRSIARWLSRLTWAGHTSFVAELFSVLTHDRNSALRRVIQNQIAAWAAPPAWLTPRMRLPAAVSRATGRAVAETEYYQLMAGESARVPKAVQKHLVVRERRQHEIDVLKAMAADGGLSDEARFRLDYLTRDPRGSDNRQASRVAGVATDARHNAALRALRYLLKSAARKWWSQTFPGIRSPQCCEQVGAIADWFSNLKLAAREAVVEILRAHNARGDQYRRVLHRNRQWILRAIDRGIRLGPFLEGMEQVVTVAGMRLRITVSTNPLETVRMGSLFDTCLNLREGCNRHSVVPNCYDANKIVVFGYQTGGSVVRARKLLAVNRNFQLIPYHTYVNVENHERDADAVREAVDRFCGQLARKSNLTLGEDGEPERLSEEWYDDGCDEWLDAAVDIFTAPEASMTESTVVDSATALMCLSS